MASWAATGQQTEFTGSGLILLAIRRESDLTIIKRKAFRLTEHGQYLHLVWERRGGEGCDTPNTRIQPFKPMATSLRSDPALERRLDRYTAEEVRADLGLDG